MAVKTPRKETPFVKNVAKRDMARMTQHAKIVTFEFVI